MTKGNENRVVAADRAERIFRRSRVERAGHRLGGGRGSLDHHHISRRLGELDRALHQIFEPLLSHFNGSKCRDWSHRGQIARRHVAGRGLGQSQLADIAGKGGLGQLESFLPEQSEQLILGVNGPLPDNANNLFSACMNIHCFVFLCTQPPLSSISSTGRLNGTMLASHVAGRTQRETGRPRGTKGPPPTG